MLKTGDVAFEFPVLGLSVDTDVWGFQDIESLTTCGPKTLKDNLQIGLELIDAGGRRWVVRSVRQLGRTGSLLSRLLSGSLFRIEQELDPLEAVSLKEVQGRVCAAMEAHPEFWCEDDELETVLVARLSEVRGTASIAAIHEVLGLDSFQAY